ncbi:zona pellucida sperm-binding protein 3-like, partial [Thalassophryne amazonica]|uniref:zona pellucida sperm-binding protein 3-like n=1 Tax=Thalassophryne amazonica TaxID=390379 RepID=UPI00147262A5
MVMKWTTACLVALAILGNFCDAQPATTTAQQQPGKQYPQQGMNTQITQSLEPPVNWEYPPYPTIPPKQEMPFVYQQPVAAVSVAVHCRESDVRVEVKKDFFGTGQFIKKDDLALGGCAGWDDATNRFVIFENALQECGSVLNMYPESLVYTFTLNYNPRPLGVTNVVRSSKAAVIVECHYQRKHNVSIGPIYPDWMPYSESKMAKDFLYFTLSLMTDDWKFERQSKMYYLGSMINIEAMVIQWLHVPLMVFVSECTATINPDPNSQPKYVFLTGNGCLIDAKFTASTSAFVNRPADNRLQFQLESFRFLSMNSDEIYITCKLKARPAVLGVSATHKACSYKNNMWLELSGQNNFCANCETLKYESASGAYGTPDKIKVTGLICLIILFTVVKRA